MPTQAVVPTEFISRHFQAVLKIHDLCEVHSLPVADARLLSYIHVKTIERGSDFPDVPVDEGVEIDALESLRGTGRWEDASSQLPETNPSRGIIEAFVGISDDLKRTDHTLREDHGMEYRLHAELRDRLRFHTDQRFRAKKLAFYRSTIRPALGDATF